MYVLASVAVENAAIDFDKEYSYLVPASLISQAKAGCRCVVTFGGGNRKRTGIILKTEQAAELTRLKPLVSLLDESPLLSEEGLFLLRHIRETTFCTWFDALRLLIPAGLGVQYQTVYSLGDVREAAPLTQKGRDILDFLRAKRAPVEESLLCGELQITAADAALRELIECGEVIKAERMKQRVLDEKQTMVRLTGGDGTAALTPKQKKAAAFLEESETASLKEICYYAGVTRVVVDGLVKKAVAEYFDCVSFRNPYAGAEQDSAEPNALSESQQAAYLQLKQAFDAGERMPALLYGVTGSGKTEVFLKLIAHVVAQGQSAVVLVPEISLTAQAVASFHKRFGSRVAVLHSGLSLGERCDEWRRIHTGGADIVVGTRSAVFAPVKNLGLIVIDEEQEHTYKSDKSPRYHARDVALARAAYNKATLLMASATPSIESYYAAQSGKYRLVTLESRFNNTLLPDVEIIDMRDAANASAYPALSAVLLEELHDNLSRGEQSILLLNRRGHSTLVRCSECGSVAECPNCSVALTYHHANDSLICHYCGYARPAKETAAECASCGSKLVRYAGIGTQKLEEELTVLFPDARILRVDMDTTMSKFSHEKLFGAFASGEYDIMLGTQMVAKGLNFPNVTLVGVLQPDQSLFAGDYRSFERTFSLLTQVVGRGGRGEKRGRACIQTYVPDNPVIMLSAQQSYPAFYAQEISQRKMHLYPPFCTLCGVGFSAETLPAVRAAAERFAEKFKEKAKSDYPDLPVRLLGPSPAEIPRAANKYRYQMIIKCRNDRRTRELLRGLLGWFVSEIKKVGIFIDMHYDRI